MLSNLSKLSKLSKTQDLSTKVSSGAQEIAESLGISGISGISDTREEGLNQLLAFVKDDSVAASYQSLGQYRSEIIKMIRNILEE